MRHAITSILKAICGEYVALADGKESATSAQRPPMRLLSGSELRNVVGGEDPNLPKGGWKAA